MIQDEISALATKIATNHERLEGHTVIVLADYQDCTCTAVGDKLGIGKLILNTMVRDKAFAETVVACADVYLKDIRRQLKEKSSQDLN